MTMRRPHPLSTLAAMLSMSGWGTLHGPLVIPVDEHGRRLRQPSDNFSPCPYCKEPKPADREFCCAEHKQAYRVERQNAQAYHSPRQPRKRRSKKRKR